MQLVMLQSRQFSRGLFMDLKTEAEKFAKYRLHDFSSWIWNSLKQETIPNSLNIPNFLLSLGG